MTSLHKPRKPPRAVRTLTCESGAGITNGASLAAAFTFPPHADLDEFGFDTTTGGAAFDIGEDSLVRRPPGRPSKPR